MEKLKDELVSLVRENKISSAFLKMSEYINDEKVLDELVLLQSKFNRIESFDLLNLEGFDDLDKHYSKISNGLLGIIRKLSASQIKVKSQIEEKQFTEKEIQLLRSDNQRLRDKLDKSLGTIKGKRLFQYQDYYPIDLEPTTDIPSLNKEKFRKSIEYFSRDDVFDRLAASDIVYLRKDNLDHEEDILDEQDFGLYLKLVEKYDLFWFIENFKKENENVFSNYIRIVNETGKTLEKSHFEILLHNVRNPLRSVIAAQNTKGLSGRKLFDPSTRFVVEYVHHQGRHLIQAFEGKGKVSYTKHFKNGKVVKATTTPVFDNRYGLVGILCINIDIDSVKASITSDPVKFANDYCNILMKDENHLKNIQ